MLSLYSGSGPWSGRLALAAVLIFLYSAMSLAQTSTATGRIAGKVTDEAGAAVAGARVTVTIPAGQAGKATTDAQGEYAVERLAPGTYTVRISAKGYQSAQFNLDVKAGSTTDASAKLVNTGVLVNVEQATVQGSVTSAEAGDLFLNGRNYLNLAELEPGLQIQDGENIDPAKSGYSSISFGGRFGRNLLVSVDGVDISDERQGGTTQEIPISGIESFTEEQSLLSVSNGWTSSGAVNITTRNGTNAIHGGAFGLFRDSAVASAKLLAPFDAATQSFLPTPYQRHQEGGRIGGPILKDKAFFFLAGERTRQHLTAPVSEASPYEQYSGTYNAPFAQDELQARLDYSLAKTTTLFARFNYFKNSDDATFFPSSFQVYKNLDYTRNAVVGAEFDAHDITHSIRFSYMSLGSRVLDATQGTALPFAGYPVSIGVGDFTVGANPLAQQATVQRNMQFLYDGIKTMGSHSVRFGFSYNRIEGGGITNLFGANPEVLGTVPGPDADPTTVPLSTAQVIVGNGQGYSTTKGAFGYPAGGLVPDNRLAIYLGDTWHVGPNVTITPALRWERDTGRTDSDLPAIPELNSAFPGFGNAVRQPNQNFAPQLGFAWDTKGTGKTVIRAGAGLYYENVLYNNILADRRLRERTGMFLATPAACSFGTAMPIPTQTAGNITVDSAEGLDPSTGRSYCADTIGQAASTLAAFQTAYQADNPYSATAQNPNFIGALLASGLNVAPALLAPTYRTPLAAQMNAGFQHEVRRGMVLSVDYVRNVETHGLLGIDINHTGASRNFNLPGAQAAVSATNSAFGCGAGFDFASINCAIKAGATISDYAANGLGSPADAGAISRCPVAGCAFPGYNLNYGAMSFLEPISRSLYRAVQMKFVDNVSNPLPWVKAANFQVAYSLSRFKSPMAFQGSTPPSNPLPASDQDSVLQASDNDHPLKFMGPSLMDRTSQVSFSGSFDGPVGFRLGMIGHFYSPLSSPAVVGSTGSLGQIFQTDFTGSGVGSQPLPGTRNGSFMRDFGYYGLNAAISRYNTTQAQQATPAGQELMTSDLFTLAQLQGIGAVAPTLSPAPFDQLRFPWVKAFDLRLSWRHTFAERFQIEPSVSVFNVLNLGNYAMPPGTMSGWLNERGGSINSVHEYLQTGETAPESNTFRVGNGTGVFSLGAPRSIEWGLRVTF